MADLTIEASAEFTAECSLSVQTRNNFTTAESDLRPWPTIAVEVADAPTWNGHGRAADLWVRCTPLLSSEGEIFDGDRPRQGEVLLDSDAQWLPYPDYFDVTTGTWSPWRGHEGFRWGSSLATQPINDELVYRMGKEMIRVNRMQLFGTRHLFSMFDAGLDDAIGWTISMVVVPEPAQQIYPLLDWGVQGGGTPPENHAFVHIGEHFSYGWNGATGIVDPVVPMSALRPCFVTLVVNPPMVSLTVSLGPGYSFRTTTNADVVTSTPMQFFLGRSMDLATQPDLSLLEVNLWGRTLSDHEITTLNGQYASVYGASSEWQS